MKEGESYELWRVYRATTSTPIAKCFRNPVALIGASRLVLEIGSLRAFVEDFD